MFKVKTLKRIAVRENEQDLEILLGSWIKAIVRYTSANPYDNPWWYNERASLSVLAGAAWTLKKWHALEEFSTFKRHRTLEPGVDSGSLRHGRCDLYIQSPGTSFAIEAKQTVQSIGFRSDGSTFAERAMRKAWQDSGDLNKQEAHRRFAVTFIVPSIPKSEVSLKENGEDKICEKKVETAINAWLDNQKNLIEQSARHKDFAYVFPRLGTPNYLYGNRYYPGVVMIFEERYRAYRRENTNE
ncbi:hypothetical protein FJP62_12175 [Pantoea vagans]|nr:hypothetical protein FJP62_12175 [Pantoea vagans]